MTDDHVTSLDDVAVRFRDAASTEPEWSDPSPGTWEAITSALGLPASDGGDVQPSGSDVATAPARMGRRAWLMAAGGFVAGGLATALGLRLADGPADDHAELVGRADLTPLDSPDETLGSAELLRDASGYSLSVDIPAGLTNPDGYVEVWLINTDGARMVSVGVFAAGTSGRFAIDQALIESGYLIVDLSNEDFDDEPRHSGDTIVRGQLV